MKNIFMFFTALSFLVVNDLHAQSDAVEEAHAFKTDRFKFTKGYMLSNEGDTLRGEIKWGLGSKSKIVIFKPENEKNKRCSAEDYVGFVRKGRRYYSCPVNYGYKVFLSRVSTERVSIYMNEVTFEGTSSYGVAGLGAIGTGIDAANAAASRHSLFLIKEGEEEYFHMAKSGFKGKIKKYFAECPDLLSHMKSEKYNYDDLYQIVKYYNLNCP